MKFATSLFISLLLTAPVEPPRFAIATPQQQSATPQQTPASAPEWELVAASKSARFYRSTKKPTRTRQTTIIAWERTVPRPDTPEGQAIRQNRIRTLTAIVGKERAEQYAFDMVLKEFNCAEGKQRQIEFVTYGGGGKFIHQISAPPAAREWTTIPPASIAERIMQKTCAAASQP